MTRTPDEIKKGLKSCHSLGRVLKAEDWCKIKCPYMDMKYGCGQDYMHGDALAYIQQLEADNAQQARCIENLTDKLNAMNDEVAQLQAERDTLVDDIRMEGGLCSICKYVDNMAHSKPCRDCNALVVSDHSNWQWRGVQKEE